MPDVTVHLADHTASGPDVIVFTSPGGKLLRNGNFRRDTWLPALAVTGLTGIHFHDLRHAGNQLIANAGANLRELMERMGHSTSRGRAGVSALDQRPAARAGQGGRHSD